MPQAAQPAERLASLRAALQTAGVDGFFLPRTDEHGSEYLPPSAGRVAWLTGFTGSAAQVLVLADRAAVFSDGRYTVQLAQEVDEALFERCHITHEPPGQWLERHLPEGGKLGFDPYLVRQAERDRLAKAVATRGGSLVPLTSNPIDAIWPDRPAAPITPVELLAERYAGVSAAQKRQEIGGELEKLGADALVVTAADAVAWLLNVRGRDIPYNPLCLSFAIVGRDGTCRWFVDERKLPPGLRLDNAVVVEPVERFMAGLSEYAGRRVAADPDEVHLGFLDRLRQGGAKLIELPSPVTLAKARKNPVEIAGAIDAQQRDGAAVARFLAWLERQPSASVDELAAADRLNYERSQDALFQGQSFPTISAHGSHAALPHYRSEPATNRRLTPGTVYLVDSGGQYLDATTDITRTVALGTVPDEIRTRATLVLKGHIAISTVVFPKGTTGAQLDTLARTAMWQQGLDFDHGTGHGVGAYLCVHEGPARISKTGGVTALAPGMILSNEPGYYKADGYGIRIENLVLVEPRDTPPGGERELLGFKTLTFCPYDRRLIDPALLTAPERAWVDAYHVAVHAALAPRIGEASSWLTAACAPL